MLDYLNVVEIEMNVNTRHFEGYETIDGKAVKKTKLIRSGRLINPNEKDIYILKNDYKLKYVVDLRSAAEVKESPSLTNIPGVEYIHLPLSFGADDAKQKLADAKKFKSDNIWVQTFYAMGGTFEAAFQCMLNGYKIILTDKIYISQVRKFFDILLNNEDGCIFYHCAAGKDRTGVMSALLLSALGFSRDTIIKDYALSSIYLNEYTTKVLEEVYAETGNQEVVNGVRLLINVVPEIMEKFLESLNNNYSSVDNYLRRALMLTSKEIIRLKEIYTE